MATEAPLHQVAVQDAAQGVSGRRASAKYAAEAIGTFVLVFTVGTAVGSGSQLAALAIGGVLMVMVWRR
jgi:aquaporin Z